MSADDEDPRLPPGPLMDEIAMALISSVEEGWTGITLRASYAEESTCTLEQEVTDGAGRTTVVETPDSLDELLDALRAEWEQAAHPPWDDMEITISKLDDEQADYRYEFSYPT